MIHHVSLGADDIARAQQFYDPLMRLVGFRRIKLDSWGVHYGTGDILFSLLRPDDGGAATAGNGVHVAFAAGDPHNTMVFYRQFFRNSAADPAGRTGHQRYALRSRFGSLRRHALSLRHAVWFSRCCAVRPA